MKIKTKIPLSMLKPKTLEGIKSLAKGIAKQQLKMITHTAALDAAALQAGYASYADARAALVS